MLDERVKTHGKSIFETENPQELKNFRANVLTRMVKFWEDWKDIKIAVAEKLSEFARREDLAGWVRPDKVNVGALADEMARLSRENAQLRVELSKRKPTDAISFQDLKAILEAKGLLEYLLL